MGAARKQSIAQIEDALGLGGVTKVYSDPTNPNDVIEVEQHKIKNTNVDANTVIEDKDILHGGIRRAGLVGLSTAGFLQSLLKGVKGRIEGLSMPGGIMLPLGILLVLFLILIPVNGHTRLMWLWLAFTGNAQIGPALIPPVQLATSGIPTNATGTQPRNPNQTGVTNQHSNNAQQATAGVNQHPQVSSQPQHQNKTKTAIHTTTSQTKPHTSSKSATGSGPGPHNPSIADPSLPISQLSYSHLLSNRLGYE